MKGLSLLISPQKVKPILTILKIKLDDLLFERLVVFSHKKSAPYLLVV
ncbi:hypothetical protein F480_09420 [Bibersteinia trehalosi Y31]|uniref:Uncharacterized protein n=1 Tax=Bibersteinia trehalosi Y31 TaxID=1261658 RepID=A0A179CYG1_BIBTR|nr:hypothetical protein F480_09420 [Bibersteinia trehalosi Y31]